MIVLTRAGVSGGLSAAERKAARERLASGLAVRLPGLVEREVLAPLQARLEHGYRLGADGLIEAHPLDPLLRFLFADAALLAIAGDLAGAPIRGFTGKIRRVEPGKGTIDWHDDLHPTQRRRLALSVNLSPRPYEGGALQIRRAAAREVFAEEGGLAAGDAVVFLVREGWRHRSEPVSGPNAKWIFSGWFCEDQTPL